MSPPHTPAGQPPIDDVLVAPTVVGKQLYDLVAEEQGIQQALYALQAALDGAIKRGEYQKVLARWGEAGEAVTSSDVNPPGITY